MSPLVLNSTMVHEIPRGKRTENGEQTVLSIAPTPLTADTDRFIREQMLIHVHAGREVVEMVSNNPLPRLVREVLTDHNLLPEHSQAITTHMHESQSGGAPAGVVMTSLATEDSEDRLLILKAEHSEGMRLRQVGTDDEIQFEVEHLRELILGDNSKVFKIASLWIDPRTDRLVGRWLETFVRVRASDSDNRAGYPGASRSSRRIRERVGSAIARPRRFITSTRDAKVSIR